MNKRLTSDQNVLRNQTHTKLAMADLLYAGDYIFTRDDACNIYRFYTDELLKLWQIKERHFPMAYLREIAVMITHGAINLPYDGMQRFSFESCPDHFGGVQCWPVELTVVSEQRVSGEVSIYPAS